MSVRSIEIFPGRFVAVSPPEPGWLVVCPSRGPAGVILTVIGEADLSTQEQLRAALVHAVDDESAQQIVVDLTGLDFCDLRGLDALYAGLEAADAAGRLMVLRHPSTRLQWLMYRFPRGRGATVLHLTTTAVEAAPVIGVAEC